MKKLIDCDRVFEVLTRGPFPSGDRDDEAVECHLESCHECRQLAEALRPALDLFHEAVEPEEYESLPGYQGVLPEAAEVSVATSTSAAIMRRRAARRRRAVYRSPGVSMVWRFAAAVLLGALVSAMIWALGNSRVDLRNSSDTSAAALSPANPRLASLDTMRLPAVCWTPHQSARVVTAVQCCTSCHHAASKLAPATVDARKTLVACTACHHADDLQL